MLTTKQLAGRWGVSEGTLRNWRLLGVGPRFIKLGSNVRYALAVIKAFEQSKKGRKPRGRKNAS